MLIEAAFGADVVERHRSHDQWQPMPSAIYMYVEDVDATLQTSAQRRRYISVRANGSALRRSQRLGQRQIRKRLIPLDVAGLRVGEADE